MLDQRSCMTCHTFQNTCAQCHTNKLALNLMLKPTQLNAGSPRFDASLFVWNILSQWRPYSQIAR
jgi:hypothetical protein